MSHFPWASNENKLSAYKAFNSNSEFAETLDQGGQAYDVQIGKQGTLSLTRRKIFIN